MPTRFALQGWLPRLFRGWWILGSRKRSSLIISHLSPGTRFQLEKGIDSRGPSFKHGRCEFLLWQVLAHWFIVFFGDLSAFFWFWITEKRYSNYNPKTNHGYFLLVDLQFCCMEIPQINKSDLSWTVSCEHASPEWCLSSSGKNHLQPTPPPNSPRNGREKLHIPQFLGAFYGYIPLSLRKRCWESRISPSNLLYPWTFDSQFKHISTTTTMPCDCPGKLRSWVAERVKTVCLQTQREAKKTKINMQLVQLTKKWNNVFFSNTWHLLYVFTCGKNSAKVLFLRLWIKSPYISDCFFL